MTKGKIVKISLLVTLILTVMLPDLIPGKLNPDLHQSSYGLPFNYVTVYGDTSTTWLVPKLFTGNDGIGINPLTFLINVFLFYWAITFVNKGVKKKRIGSNQQ